MLLLFKILIAILLLSVVGAVLYIYVFRKLFNFSPK